MALMLGLPVYPVGTRFTRNVFSTLWEPQVADDQFLGAPFRGH